MAAVPVFLFSRYLAMNSGHREYFATVEGRAGNSDKGVYLSTYLSIHSSTHLSIYVSTNVYIYSSSTSQSLFVLPSCIPSCHHLPHPTHPI